MSTAWTVITALLSAGLGAVLRDVVSWLLNRDKNGAELTDLSVQTAERLLARAELAVTAADTKLIRAEATIADLRQQLAETRAELATARSHVAEVNARSRVENQILRSELDVLRRITGNGPPINPVSPAPEAASS